MEDWPPRSAYLSIFVKIGINEPDDSYGTCKLRSTVYPLQTVSISSEFAGDNTDEMQIKV